MRRLLALLVFVSCAACHDRGEEHFRKGNVRFANRDLAGAESEYRQAIEKNPKHAPALEGLGNVAFEKGDLEQAGSLYRRAIDTDPKALEARHRLAVTQSTRGDTKGAIATLEEALQIDARDAYALHALGGLYQKMGDLKRAEAMQVAVLGIDRDHRAARFALANIELDTGRLDEAERELSKLYAGDGKPLAEYGFARLAALRGRYAEAAKRLQQVIALGVSHPEKILTDRAFEKAWSDPPMAAVREALEQSTSGKAAAGTSTTGAP